MPNVPSNLSNAGALGPQPGIEHIASPDHQPNLVAGPNSSAHPKGDTPSELKAIARKTLFSMLAIDKLEPKSKSTDPTAVPERDNPIITTPLLPSWALKYPVPVEGASLEESASLAE